MRITMYKTITEALGFAVHRFDTMARVAWLPALLVVLFSLVAPYVLASVIAGGVVTVNDYTPARLNTLLVKSQVSLWSEHFTTMLSFVVISYLFQMLMYASFFVPMLKLAARGEEPSHRSAVLHLGPRHLKFIATGLVAVSTILLVLWGPVVLSVYFIEQYVTQAMATDVAVFPDPDSLHRVEITRRMTDATAFAGLAWLLQIIAGLAILYVSLRLFALPFFATVREKSDSYNSLRASWQLSAGWNVLKLGLVVFVLWLFAMIISVVLNMYVYPLTLTALNGMYGLVASTFNLMAELGTENSALLRFLQWVWVMVGVIFNMAYLFFAFGLTAGLGGSLFHQYKSATGES